MIYNPVYSPLREVVTAAAYGKSFNRLVKATNVRIEGGGRGRRKRGKKRKKGGEEEEVELLQENGL